jgi:hypothetical protein
MRAPSFLNWLFRTARRFASYDECPEIYYRFNNEGEYGPQKLDRFIAFFEDRPTEPIEGRFSDETCWRSKAYFFDLWQQVPPSAHTIKRLTREGIPVDANMTEALGRELLRGRQRAKPPTPKQLQHLQTLGVESQDIANREQANSIISAREAAIREQQREAEEAQRRIDDAPQVEQCRARLSELAISVNAIAPAWKPDAFGDLNSLLSYIDAVAEALDYATSFDLEYLYGGPFLDPLKSEDYYLEFTRDPTADELRSFQADVFVHYLNISGESFDHLRLLRKAFLSVKVTRL